MFKNYKFKDIVIEKKGFLRGPFGGDLKKEIFVEKSENTYKVYEQGVVLNSDKNIGRYYISEKDYLSKLHKFSVENDDFLVSCSGVNMGAIYQLKSPFERGIINQALLRIRLNSEKINDNYFYYLFKELISKRIVSGSGDSTIPNFPGLDTIRNIDVELPNISSQKKIGAMLSALDDKIELNNKINIELEQMAKTLYDYWFVQFDFPNEAGKPYKSSGGEMVYNAVLKREIPIGWEVKSLYQIANITMGQSPSGTSYNENGEGMIFFQGSTDFGWRFPTNRIYTTAPTRFALENDILLSVRAPIGTMNVSATNCCIGRGLSALNSKDGFNSYLIYQMNYFKKKFDYLNSVGTTFGSLTKDDLYNLQLVYPSKEILKNFEKIVSKFDKKIEINSLQNQELATLRDWLLPMLMNGQVSVGESEGEVLGLVAEERGEYKKM